jgi:type 1 fimbria pilin
MQPLATFTTSTVRFVVPACTVAVDPTVVTLPTVMASNFSGPNSTAGQTGFDVKLTCSASTNLSITLATSSPATGVSGTGVIAPTSGSGMAQGIGVQIRDGNGNPISFNTAIPAGTTSSGPYAIPFQARYYQTAAVISGGNVSATATYTLTYQ